MSETIKAWDAFELIALPLRGAGPLKGLKRGQAVSAGELVAVQPEPRMGPYAAKGCSGRNWSSENRLDSPPALGDVHTSVSGQVEEINEIEIIIRRDDQAVGHPPEPRALGGLPALDLARALKELGLDLPKVQPGDTLIISRLNPEPGLALARALFGEQRETILAGLEAAGRLWPNHRLKWAVGRPEELPPKAEGLIVDGKYPYTLPTLIKKQMLGLSDPAASGVLSGRELFLLGRVWRTGLPLTTSPITLGGSNYFIPPGARVIDLLTFANLMPGPADAVIKGGLVLGRSLSRLERGLDQSAAALHLVRGAGTKTYDPCRECGECTRACPIRLPIARLAGGQPGDWPDRMKWPELDTCLICGACALACPSGRPLLSLARLAEAAVEVEEPRQ